MQDLWDMTSIKKKKARSIFKLGTYVTLTFWVFCMKMTTLA